MNLDEAIEALNKGCKLTHPRLKEKGKYIIKNPNLDIPVKLTYDVGFDSKLDPEYRDTIHRKGLFVGKEWCGQEMEVKNKI